MRIAENNVSLGEMVSVFVGKHFAVGASWRTIERNATHRRPPMKLRELVEKVTGEIWSYEPEDYSQNRIRCGKILVAEMVGDSALTQHRAALIVALHKCAPELLRVREAAEEATRLRGPWKENSTFYNEQELANDALDAALRDLKEKEGKL